MPVDTARAAHSHRSGRYQALAVRLTAARADSVTLPVDEIDSLVGGLPAVAHRQTAWWANDAARAQARAWLDVGFKVAAVDPGGAVRFMRVSGRVAGLELLALTGLSAVVVGRLDRRSGQVLADAGG